MCMWHCLMIGFAQSVADGLIHHLLWHKLKTRFQILKSQISGYIHTFTRTADV